MALTPEPAGEGHVGQAQRRGFGWRRRVGMGLTVVDGFAVVVAVTTAQLARFGDPGLANPLDISRRDAAYVALSIVLAITWLVALSATRSRTLRNIGIGLIEYQRVLQATFGTFGLLAITALLLQVNIVRGYLAIALPLGLALLIIGRVIWRRRLLALRRTGQFMTDAIVVGSPNDVRHVVAQLRQQYRVGYRAIAVSVPGSDESSLAGLPAVALEDVAGVSKSQGARAVIVAGDIPGGRESIRTLGWDLENSQVELILMSRLTDVAGPRTHWRPITGLPMVHVDLPQYTGVNHALKRGFDIALAGLATILLSPLLGIIALAVRLDSPGVVIFRQQRVGAHGTHFTMLKFRSMVTDAEARLAALQEQNEGNGMLFKMKSDPRVTRVGRVLRKFSLDELPQLWNVLRGDMSLVGPRPPLPREVEQYEGHVSRRLLTRPGITGLWQVSGRSNLSAEESIQLDLSYVENWSIAGDIVILARTVRAVVGSDGAY